MTIRVGGQLRGCVGIMEQAGPLLRNVTRCAVMAATEDSRFDPLTRLETASARFEISVLTRPRPLSDPRDLQIGRDGVIVSRGRAKGLLLPQVAVEQGWNEEEFLSAACRKAGLSPRAWLDPSVGLESFTAEVFRDVDATP